MAHTFVTYLPPLRVSMLQLPAAEVPSSGRSRSGFSGFFFFATFCLRCVCARAAAELQS